MNLAAFTFESLRDDGETSLLRGRNQTTTETHLLLCQSGLPSAAPAVARLQQEFSLRERLDQSWALMPQAPLNHEGRPAVLLRDPGGTSLATMIGKAFGLRSFLSLAIELAEALQKVHAAHLIHRDIRPANIFVDRAGRVLLTGFGVSSPLARERSLSGGFDIPLASLPYMAPELSGRLNRSVDYRSDLYSFGITLYEMLVGARPFQVATPAEWIFSHVARAPPPPSVRVEGVPDTLDAIILKLLSKNAEDRYQSAAGASHDLRYCLSLLERDGAIASFPIAKRDLSPQLNLPERLYGREAEAAVLLEAFRNIADHPRFELLLVSGEPGIGKSSVVSELRSAVYAASGIFAAGKFDQYQRNIPYATLVEALRGVLRNLLTEDDPILDRWRNAFKAALGISGQLMIDLLPELQLIVGPQPPLTPLSPLEAKNRFRLIFCRFMGVLATSDHPLVLFLDDLQWVDGGTLDLVELIATEEQIPHLLLVGTYRDTEVGAQHGLTKLVERIAIARGGVQELQLKSLSASDLTELARDAFGADAEQSASLADLLLEKTRGNPFFVGQFLRTLSAEQLLTFDMVSGRWRWDLEAIRRKGITDNVAALLADKLGRLRGRGRKALGYLACLGSRASTELLSNLAGMKPPEVEKALAVLVGGGLVHRTSDGFEFAHDRVREAAYSGVPATLREELHLLVARGLLGTAIEEAADDSLFEIVDHYKRASRRVVEQDERRRAAKLNFIAGQRSKEAAAYESALAYYQTGLDLLGDDGWSHDLRLTFDLSFNAADCHFMIGDFDRTEEALKRLAEESTSSADLRAVVGRQLSFYVYVGRVEHAVDLSLDCLARMGVKLPLQPTSEDLEQEYRAWMEGIGERPLSALVDLPRATDPHHLEVMSALTDLFSPAGTVNSRLHHLAALRMANLSLAHGHTDESTHAYACLAGQVLGWHLGTFVQAKELARATLELVEDLGYDRRASRVYAVISGTVGPWSMPLLECYSLAVKATDLDREQGGIVYSGYAWGCALTALMDSGRSLAEVERQAEASLAIVEKLRFPLVADFMTAQLMVARALRGATKSIQSMEDSSFDEASYEARLEQGSHLWHALVRYRIRKLQLCFIGRDFEACSRLLEWLDQQVGELKVFELAEYHFYSALARTSWLRGDHLQTSPYSRERLQDSCDKLAAWSRLCPENFASRSTLVEAELARLDHRYLEAELSYEAAIEHARANGFQQIEAIASECASAFYADRGFKTIAEAYACQARAAYDRWGANAKARQIDVDLPASTPNAVKVPDTRSRIEHLDLAAAVSMYQALSQEIVLERLIDRLMSTVVEHAGAVRGLLLLSREGRLRIVAEATMRESQLAVSSRKPSHFAGELPQSVLNYVSRTQEIIIIDDALEANAHSGDPYILRAKPRSLLCLPLVKQARLVGVLYLENDLASHIFTEDRVSLLRLVASQAAILIENAELFQDVQKTQEEARQAGAELRQSFDMISALAWSASPEGIFEFSNKQWHDYTGISEQAARGGSWMQAFHPDDHDKIGDKWRQLTRFKASGEFEARIRAANGRYRRFLVRLAPMCDIRGDIIRWHGTNTDIDDIKRAEEAQEALARASRVTALGALSVSIAHEVNQPLMAIVTNAATCLRWLNGSPPDIAEARLAADRIIRDGHRAGDVIASIRAMARNSGPEPSRLDLRELTLEVLQLLGNELDRYGISVTTDFEAVARPVFADRVQVQQVILNLVMNSIEAIATNAESPREIRIEAAQGEGSFTKVSISDTGVGLDPEVRDRIFESFFTTKKEGVGIGLSICRTIVESLGGQLWATDNLPSGTVFTFSLPQAANGSAQ